MEKPTEEEEVLPDWPSKRVYSWWLPTAWNSILDEPINYPQTDRAQPWIENALLELLKSWINSSFVNFFFASGEPKTMSHESYGLCLPCGGV